MKNLFFDIWLTDWLELFQKYYKNWIDYNSSSILIDFNRKVVAININPWFNIDIISIAWVYDWKDILVNWVLQETKNEIYLGADDLANTYWTNRYIDFFNNSLVNHKIEIRNYKHTVMRRLYNDVIYWNNIAKIDSNNMLKTAIKKFCKINNEETYWEAFSQLFFAILSDCYSKGINEEDLIKMIEGWIKNNFFRLHKTEEWYIAKKDKKGNIIPPNNKKKDFTFLKWKICKKLS